MGCNYFVFSKSSSTCSLYKKCPPITAYSINEYKGLFSFHVSWKFKDCLLTFAEFEGKWPMIFLHQKSGEYLVTNFGNHTRLGQNSTFMNLKHNQGSQISGKWSSGVSRSGRLEDCQNIIWDNGEVWQTLKGDSIFSGSKLLKIFLFRFWVKIGELAKTATYWNNFVGTIVDCCPRRRPWNYLERRKINM